MTNDITTKAITTFNQNLKYLQESHKQLYEKIVLFNLLLEQGTYQEKYTLEYNEEGYFDILELTSNEFLYKENSILHAERMLEVTDLKREGGVFKGLKYVYATKEQAEEINQSALSFHNSLWATIKIIQYVSTYASSKTNMNRVNKVIFLDIGLGLHLESIINKLNPQVVFIKEKSLETFRLSLFVTNYKKLSLKSFLHFSITDNPNEEQVNFVKFLDQGNNHNLHLKYIPFSSDYQPQLQRLQSHVLSQSYINYGYSAMLLRFINSPKYLAEGRSFLNVAKSYHNNIFSEKPVLLLFSGPSTSKNMEWLKLNHHKFIVVSALSTCRLLNQANIRPDIVMHIDPGADGTALLFEGIDTKIYFKDTVALLASNVDEKTVSRFDPSHVHFIEQGTLYKKGFGRLSAPSVGEYTYALLLVLGARNLFLLGIDLALDNETFQTHGGFHPFQKKGDDNQKNASLDPGSSISYTRGNFLENVPSTHAYMLSISQFETFTKMLKKEYHNIYNLSDGAFLDGASPLKIDTYHWDTLSPLDTDSIAEKITSYLQEIGDANFIPEDQAEIKYQIKEAKHLEKAIKKFQKKKFHNVNAYLNALAKFTGNLSDMDKSTNSDLAQVYYEYFPIILSYIFDLFNTKELKKPDQHVTKINAILIEQLLKMSSLYISTLESYFLLESDIK